MLTIGSQALREHIKVNRESLDTDYIAYESEIHNFVLAKQTQGYELHKHLNKNINNIDFQLFKFRKDNKEHIYEFEVAKPGNLSSRLYDFASNDVGTIRHSSGHETMSASLNLLYMLKMSHRFRKNSPHFLKTMNDIHLMRKHKAEIPSNMLELYKEREKWTYYYSHPKLNTSKSEFFKKEDAQIYKYDHDDIHIAVKHLEQPAYRYYMKDNNEVQCDKNKWNALSDEHKLLGVLEECYVLALERSQIPFPDTPRLTSFKIALGKVCSSITSSWFREFSWENYYKVLKMYNPNYVDKFNEALNAGNVKLFSGQQYATSN